MAYQNSNVTYGRGVGVVVNTGMFTEVGKIADMLANADETDTPLKQSLNQLSKVLTYLIVGIAAVTFLIGVFVRGEAPLNGLMVAVALPWLLSQKDSSHCDNCLVNGNNNTC